MSEYHDTETGEIIPPQGSFLASTETAEVWSALIDAQSKIEPPQRSKTAKIKGRTKDGIAYEYEYKYAPLDEILSKARKPLAQASLGHQQFPTHRGNQPVIRTVIFHKSGQWTANDYPIFYDASKGAQGFAAGVTTARRMGLTLALGLAPEDDNDHDADAPAVAQPSAPVTRGATRTATPKAQPAAKPAPVNGDARPGWIAKFLALDSYEIDPKKVGSWSAWEKHYLQVAEAIETAEQWMKLANDNEVHIQKFAVAVKREVFDDFLKRRDVIAAKFPPEWLVDEDDAERARMLKIEDADKILQI